MIHDPLGAERVLSLMPPNWLAAVCLAVGWLAACGSETAAPTDTAEDVSEGPIEDLPDDLGDTETMHHLGTLGGASSNAYGINELGQVVGESDTDNGVSAFVWTPGGVNGALANPQMRALPALGAVSRANDINELGVAVGFSELSPGIAHPALWTATGELLDLGNLGGEFGEAQAITDDGTVVGVSATADGGLRAFRWTEADGMVDLGTLRGLDSAASGVNSSGTIVGVLAEPGALLTGEGAFFAVSWTDGVISELPALDGGGSLASAINDDGDIVGASLTADGNPHAVLWPASGGGPIDLGTLGGPVSFAFDINNAGTVAGDGPVGSDDTNHAWIWQAGDTSEVPALRDIGTLGGTLAVVHAVNDRGQVVGGSAVSGSEPLRAFVWGPP